MLSMQNFTGNDFVKRIYIFLCNKGASYKFILCLLHSTVKPVLSDQIKQDIFLAFQTGVELFALLSFQQLATTCQ